MIVGIVLSIMIGAGDPPRGQCIDPFPYSFYSAGSDMPEALAVAEIDQCEDVATGDGLTDASLRFSVQPASVPDGLSRQPGALIDP